MNKNHVFKRTSDGDGGGGGGVSVSITKANGKWYHFDGQSLSDMLGFCPYRTVYGQNVVIQFGLLKHVKKH